MKRIATISIFLLFSILLFSQENEKTKIVIGTKIAKPFVINNGNEFSGISFELWNKISNELNIDYEVKVFGLQELIDAVNNKEVDVAVSPLTITSEREKLFDFTHPYFTTGLSIATTNKSKNNLLGVAQNVFSKQFLNVVFLIFLVLFLVGFFVWLFEREKNKEQFGDGITKGLGSSFWWAAVTMTTVGYGDKTPKTIGGRTIALIWMFAGLIMISGFTAAIASALTVDSLEYDISNLNDLHNLRVGTVVNSSSVEYLNQNGVNFITAKNVKAGISLIQENKLDAFIYDAPILKYFIKTNNISNQIKILPLVLNPISYGFAIPSNSELREKINRVLLKEINNSEWKTIVNSYLGN
ncbi:MAG: transporter substrate-binding domain-containing protein [Ignavibacteriae bacterium]|nr:transporter substrate-binding domain-containing protein [Ignavibacteriota bacterium]